jgi:molecular chaperone DnaJ
MKDFYKILGVEKNATSEEIRNAYRRCVKKHHPDVNPGDSEAEKRFCDIQEAYESLIDLSKKTLYEKRKMSFRHRSSKESSENLSEFSFENNKKSFFGNSSFKGKNIKISLDIDFKDVFSGVTKSLKIKKRKRCTLCSCDDKKDTGKCTECLDTGYSQEYIEKNLDVFIPSGVKNGMQIKIVGEGEESSRGGNYGDLIVLVSVKDHDIFQRNGLDIIVDVPVSYTQLVFGDEIEIPSLAEGVLKFKIPSGSQSHTKFRLKGKGIPVSGNIGDLIVVLKVEVPKNFNEEYLEVLKKLSDFEKNNITPKKNQWFKKTNLKNE